jgi:Protein of unknown function (DUF2569)
MNSIKCPECGLVNFASATECNRCHVTFQLAEPVVEATRPAVDDAQVKGPRPVLESEKKDFSDPLPEIFDDEPASFSLVVILFGLTLFLTIALVVYNLQRYSTLMRRPGWKLIIDPREKLYIPGLEAMIYFEWLSKIIILLAAIGLLLLLARKSWLFLKWVRFYLIAGFIYNGVEIAGGLALRATLAQKQLGFDSGPIQNELYWGAFMCVLATLLAFLWFRYFTTSERVQRIFVK